MTTAKTALVVLAILVALVLLGPLLAGGMMGPGFAMGPGMMYGYGGQTAPGGSGWAWGLGMGVGWLAMLAFWGALILGAVLLVRWIGGGSAAEHPTDGSALDILKRRLAAGEINQQEYDQLRKTLETS
jgi:putative membrane protein